MAFLIGSSVRQFQSKISGGMERSQAVITPGENYPGLKANRMSLFKSHGIASGTEGSREFPSRDRSR